MFQYQDKVNAGVPQICTPEIWDQLIDSPEVKSVCDQIAALDPTTPDYNDRKQALKRRLPIIIPHAASFRNGKRVSADAIPSGLAMLDVDHVANPRDWFESIDKQLLSDNRIYLVAITASGQGLRLIGERLETESIEAAQLRIATALGIKEYDAVTKDLARASYVVPRSYILWIYEAGLFAEREVLSIDSGLYPEKALPPHQEVSSIASESDSDIEVLTYRGMPYDAIVKQLMIEIGAAEGAMQGERNTVYFSLANYMRYICDFDPALLLRILPDFGLSEAERRQAISSAIGRPRKSQKPMVLQSAIAICEKEAHLDEQSPLEKSTALPLPELPRLLKLVCRRLPEDYRAAMIIASLPVLGTLATRIRFEYLDRQEHSTVRNSRSRSSRVSPHRLHPVSPSSANRSIFCSHPSTSKMPSNARRNRRTRTNSVHPRTARTNRKIRTLVRVTMA